MTVKTLNNVMVIEANFSMEELFKVYKHKPDVLSLKDDDGNMLFAVKPSEHRESFSDCGISFVSNSYTASKASITIPLPSEAANNTKVWIAENFGSILINLEQIERNVSEACIDIDANIAKIVGSIVTA